LRLFGVTESHARLGQKAPAVMMHTARETEGGIEFRTRFWMGARLVVGKPECVLPPGAQLPVFIPMGLPATMSKNIRILRPAYRLFMRNTAISLWARKGAYARKR
jgi:hypothetical protein